MVSELDLNRLRPGGRGAKTMVPVPPTPPVTEPEMEGAPAVEVAVDWNESVVVVAEACETDERAEVVLTRDGLTGSEVE